MRCLRVTVERVGRDPGDNEILDVAMIRMEGKPHDGVADYCAEFSEGGGQLPAARSQIRAFDRENLGVWELLQATLNSAFPVAAPATVSATAPSKAK